MNNFIDQDHHKFSEMQSGTGFAQIRPIQEPDNAAIAKIIRDTLEEFGANHPGTVYFDASTDHLYELFSNTPGSVYYIVTLHNKTVGGGGIFPTDGLPEGTCELVKMYLLPEARGRGIGTDLILRCMAYAKDAGYRQIYLESMPELQQALKTYEKLGFAYLSQPLGNTGHFGCGRWMLRSLT